MPGGEGEEDVRDALGLPDLSALRLEAQQLREQMDGAAEARDYREAARLQARGAHTRAPTLSATRVIVTEPAPRMHHACTTHPIAA